MNRHAAQRFARDTRAFGTVLLRLVLSLAVAIGGISGASAAPDALLSSQLDGIAKCHDAEHMDVGASGTMMHHQHADPDQQLPDCCSSAACACAGVHSVGVAMPTLAGASLGVVYALPVSAPDSGHASPILAPLLEPPIA